MNVPHIAVVNHSTIADDRDVAFWVAAANRHLTEHVAPAWGRAPAPVFFYGKAEKVPSVEGAIIAIVDDDGNAEAAGYHGAIGKVPFAFVDMGQSSSPSLVLAHEADELWGNPTLDLWHHKPGSDLWFAQELDDPDQRTGYPVEVEVMGERRTVEVPNFVLPAWFRVGVGHQYDFLGNIRAPFTCAEGGYAIAQDESGHVVYLAPDLGDDALASVHDKLHRLSRASRLRSRPF